MPIKGGIPLDVGGGVALVAGALSQGVAVGAGARSWGIALGASALS